MDRNKTSLVFYIKRFKSIALINYLRNENYLAEADILEGTGIDGKRFVEFTISDPAFQKLTSEQKKLIVNCRDTILKGYYPLEASIPSQEGASSMFLKNSNLKKSPIKATPKYVKENPLLNCMTNNSSCVQVNYSGNSPIIMEVNDASVFHWNYCSSESALSNVLHAPSHAPISKSIDSNGASNELQISVITHRLDEPIDIKDGMQKYLFFRNISREDARRLLTHTPNLRNGTFLFRSSTKSYAAITIYDKNQYYDIAIQKTDNNKFYCQTEISDEVAIFDSFQAFLNYYKTHSLILASLSGGKLIYLKLSTIVIPTVVDDN